MAQLQNKLYNCKKWKTVIFLCAQMVHLAAFEWSYLEIRCVFLSPDFSAVLVVTSLCAAFFEMGSFVGFVVLSFRCGASIFNA